MKNQRRSETNFVKYLFVSALSMVILLALLSYPIKESFKNNDSWGIEIHITKLHYDRYGNLKSKDHHAGNLTDYGANWISDVLGDADGDQADCIGLTNSTTAYADNWVVLPDEITTEGLSRAQGSYVDDGTGAWNITHTFSVTGTNSCQRAGLYTLTSGSNLVASDTFSLTNVANGDSLQIIFQISVSD